LFQRKSDTHFKTQATCPLRQLCIFGLTPHTIFLEGERMEMVVEVFNSPEGS